MIETAIWIISILIAIFLSAYIDYRHMHRQKRTDRTTEIIGPFPADEPPPDDFKVLLEVQRGFFVAEFDSYNHLWRIFECGQPTISLYMAAESAIRWYTLPAQKDTVGGNHE